MSKTRKIRKKINIMFLTLYGFNGASSRYRVYQYLPFLKEAGIDYRIYPFYTDKFDRISAKLSEFNRYLGRIFNKGYLYWGYLRRFFRVLDAGKYELIFMQKEPMPRFLLNLLLRCNARLLFDFDDAVYLSKQEQLRAFGRVMLKGTKEKIDYALRRARKVIVGNDFIGSYAKAFSLQVTKIPIAIDTHRYPYIRKDYGKDIILGWIGRERNICYLEGLSDVFKRLGEISSDFQLLVIGAGEKKINIYGIPLRSLAWSYQTEIANLSGIDIGLMPLGDDNWSRGKGGCKLLQYMALGIPTVSSPVGINADIIRDGINGFLASTPDEWIDKIARLAKDKDLRNELGRKARETVENDYSLDRWAKVFIETITKDPHAT